jgi:hypothetical protein
MDISSHMWDLWYPKAAATGLSFARCCVAPTSVLLVHAAPPVLTVTVRDGRGRVLAEGVDLEQTSDTPISRLIRHDSVITRIEIWPTEEDLGSPVVLPGGEAAILTAWWNASDHSEWRWQIELYNHR